MYTNHVGYNDQSTETNLAQLKRYLLELKIGNNNQTFSSSYRLRSDSTPTNSTRG